MDTREAYRTAPVAETRIHVKMQIWATVLENFLGSLQACCLCSSTGDSEYYIMWYLAQQEHRAPWEQVLTPPNLGVGGPGRLPLGMIRRLIPEGQGQWSGKSKPAGRYWGQQEPQLWRCRSKGTKNFWQEVLDSALELKLRVCPLYAFAVHAVIYLRVCLGPCWCTCQLLVIC